MVKVMEEDLNEEQVRNVFYFATNWHTVVGAPRKVTISFHERDRAPTAATCSWSLRMPNCLADGDTKGTSPASRQRMLQGPAVTVTIIVTTSHIPQRYASPQIQRATATASNEA